MKKLLLCFFCIFLFLSGCRSQNYKVVYTDNTILLDETNLYFPIPIKNNSIFLGFEVVDNKHVDYAKYRKNYGYDGIELFEDSNQVFPEITYDLLKEFSKNKQLKLRVKYQELSDDELFRFNKPDEFNYYLIEGRGLDKYPREITIPSLYNGLDVKEVDEFGFYNFHDLVIVNIPKNMYVNKYGFAQTSLYQISKKVNADSSAFSNTFLKGQVDYKLNFLEGSINKEIRINDILINLEIDLNGGKVIQEELDLFISRPILENKIFLGYENEAGYKIEIPDDKLYRRLTLKEYYRNVLGMEYRVNSEEVTDDIYNFRYLEETDSYALYFLKNDLQVSKLVLPSRYNDKPITEIRDFNNKFINHVVIGDYVEKINGVFDTPNLKKVEFSDYLREIKKNAFSGTLLTEVELPNSIKVIDDGVFAFTFVKEFTIKDSIEKVSGNAFARNNEFIFKSNNENFVIRDNGKYVTNTTGDKLLLHSYSDDYQVVNLQGIKKIEANVFSYQRIDTFINYNGLEKIKTNAFYNARINELFDLDSIEISENSFNNAKINNLFK